MRMGLSMRRFVGAAVAGCLVVASATAADWPGSGTVRILVPFGPGSTPDIIARVLADQFSQTLAANFVIENKPGASGNIGTDAVAKAKPDGTTLGLSIPGPLAINSLLFKTMPYDLFRDFKLISMVATQPSVLAVNASLGVDSVSTLVEHIRREPDKFSFGSIGTGSLSHLAMEAIALKSSVHLVHVPYASSPQAVTALVRGDVQMACLPAISVVPLAKSGSLKVLAVTTAQPSPLLPEVATLKASGIDVDAAAWTGLVAPAHTPDTVINAINHEVVAALSVPAVRNKLAQQMMEPIGSTPAEFKAAIEAEIARWAPIIKAANIHID